MKILIVRFSSIGDIVLTTPVIRCLKSQIPDCEIHYFTKQAYVGLLDNNPHISKVWVLSDDIKPVLSELKQEGFDYILDLHNNLRTKRVSLRLGVETKRLDKLNIQKWLLVRFHKNTMPDKHIVDRYLDVAQKFNVKNDDKGLDYFIPSDTKIDVSLPNQYICYAIGGQHNTKKMPLTKMIDLCNELQHKVVVIGGKEDNDIGSKLADACSEVINLCGRISIHQSALVMRGSTSVITHDTGMMHIASALKKKVLSIWGNTVPSLGMYPYLPDPASKIFEVEGLSCRPCSKIGFDTCPKGHFDCMQLQDTKAIALTTET
ncbi:MAG: ADP-heptose:LPS heptosyltransferase [Bacteroidia bacterium]|jgi:ADP-heptose:LPS heptosyltransferase